MPELRLTPDKDGEYSTNHQRTGLQYFQHDECHIDARNDKEEETVYCVTASYDSYNINANNYYLQTSMMAMKVLVSALKNITKPLINDRANGLF